MQITHLNGWRAVDAVLRHGGIAGAADVLAVTEAAVTAQIRRLEERLGRTLFQRTQTGLVALPELLAVAPTLQASFDGLGSAQNALRVNADDRRVSLTVTLTFAETWLPHHLPDFYAQMGAFELSLDSTWEVVDLRNSHHHFAIRYMGPPNEGLEAVDLMPSGVVPVCTPDFAKRYNLTPDTKTLDGVPIVEIDVYTTDPDWEDWQGWSKRTGIALGSSSKTPRLQVDGSGSRIARSGLGLVLGGVSEVLQDVAAGRLIMPFGSQSVVPAQYWHRLVWTTMRSLGPAQRKVRDWIAKKAEDDRAEIQRLFRI